MLGFTGLTYSPAKSVFGPANVVIRKWTELSVWESHLNRG